MDRFLIEYAYMDLDLAGASLLKADEDERYLRPAANHTEQAIEKILKQIAKESGLRVSEDHKIARLLEVIPRVNRYISEEQLDFLEPYSGMLVGWATSVKYNGDCLVTRRTVVKLYNFAKELYNGVVAAIAVADCENSNTQCIRVDPRSSSELKGLSLDAHIKD